MADIINLRTERKRNKRKAREQAAEQNRIRHGLSLNERKVADTLQEKQKRGVEGHKIEPVDRDD